MTGRFDRMDYALCGQVDPDLWFPASGDNGTSGAAKTICGTCVVKAPCTVFHAGFSDINDSYGIAGGTSSAGRRKVRRLLLAETIGDAA